MSDQSSTQSSLSRIANREGNFCCFGGVVMCVGAFVLPVVVPATPFLAVAGFFTAGLSSLAFGCIRIDDAEKLQRAASGLPAENGDDGRSLLRAAAGGLMGSNPIAAAALLAVSVSREKQPPQGARPSPPDAERHSRVARALRRNRAHRPDEPSV